MDHKTAKRLAFKQVDAALKLPEEWSRTVGPMVIDPDGWRSDFPGLKRKSWREPITYAEFKRRAHFSTCTVR